MHLALDKRRHIRPRLVTHVHVHVWALRDLTSRRRCRRIHSVHIAPLEKKLIRSAPSLHQALGNVVQRGHLLGVAKVAALEYSSHILLAQLLGRVVARPRALARHGCHHLQHYEDNYAPSSSAWLVLYATQTFFKRMLRAGFAMAQSCSSTSYHILIAVQVCSIVTNRIFFSA